MWRGGKSRGEQWVAGGHQSRRRCSFSSARCVGATTCASSPSTAVAPPPPAAWAANACTRGVGRRRYRDSVVNSAWGRDLLRPRGISANGSVTDRRWMRSGGRERHNRGGGQPLSARHVTRWRRGSWNSRATSSRCCCCCCAVADSGGLLIVSVGLGVGDLLLLMMLLLLVRRGVWWARRYC